MQINSHESNLIVNFDEVVAPRSSVPDDQHDSAIASVPTRIAVTNRIICYQNYIQSGLASESDTPVSCLVRQIHRLADSGKYDRILIREKDLSQEDYFLLVEACSDIAPNKIILHNYASIANEMYQNLHLPFARFESMAKNIRKEYPHIKTISTSVHSIEDACFAQSHGADYVIAGHVFDTDCKKGLAGRGILWLKSICDAISIPVYAIGGISNSNLHEVISLCPVAGVCMMSACMTPNLT